MLIGIDARMYGNKVTGIGNYVKNLTDNLFAIDQDNQYILFMLNDGYNKFTPPNERIKKIKVDCYWYTLKEQTRLFRIMEKYKTDIMHFPNFNVPLFYTGNFVVTIHDMTTRFFPGQKIRKILFRKWAYEVVFRSAILRSGNIITVS